KKACEMLLCSKTVIGNQSVLLAGVNDNVKTMISLSHRLLQMGVRPYCLYLCDLITGSRHFRVRIEKGIEVIKNMVGFTSGYAIPQLIIDAPGGGG
ncbi:lysine 2,3-aminomutase, partial [Clostridium perfringens]|nr:lysine 2,3-aminomutase [Clostridium perfringens]